jgi:acyl-CoA thioesterase-2
MVAVDAILAALQLQPTGDGRFQAGQVDGGHGFVFGGQLLAQAVVAASASQPDKRLKTLHTVFARAGSTQSPLEIAVTPIGGGRSVASVSVAISQNAKILSHSTALLSADEPDLIRHAPPGPALAAPADRGASGEWEIDTVGGVDISDPDAVGPAELDVWTRFAGAPEDPVVSQALLAYATDGFLIGTAMRPHPGVGQALAHRTLSTTVLGHTLTFHEPVAAGDWLLMRHQSPYAGRGRSYGRADVFDPAGQLVASFVQDNMIRPRPEGSGVF